MGVKFRAHVMTSAQWRVGVWLPASSYPTLPIEPIAFDLIGDYVGMYADKCFNISSHNFYMSFEIFFKDFVFIY